MSASRRCSTGWSAQDRAGRRHAGRDPRPPRGRGPHRRPELPHLDTAGYEDARPTARSKTGCARRPRSRIREADVDPVHDRRPRRRDAARRALRRRCCAGPARRSHLIANKAEGRAAEPGCWRPMRSASASRWRCRPSTAWASPTFSHRLAGRRRAPRRPMPSADDLMPEVDVDLPRTTARPRRAGAALGPKPLPQRRHHRPAQRRQIDADQPHGRRRAAADRSRSRHHPRLHRGAAGSGKAARSTWSTPPACAARRASRRSSRSWRSATRCARSSIAEVVVLLLDATIPFEKQDLALADLVEREGRALVIAVNKWDLDRGQERRRWPKLREQLRAAAAAAARRAAGHHLGPARAATSTG